MVAMALGARVAAPAPSAARAPAARSGASSSGVFLGRSKRSNVATRATKAPEGLTVLPTETDGERCRAPRPSQATHSPRPDTPCHAIYTSTSSKSRCPLLHPSAPLLLASSSRFLSSPLISSHLLPLPPSLLPHSLTNARCLPPFLLSPSFLPPPFPPSFPPHSCALLPPPRLGALYVLSHVATGNVSRDPTQTVTKPLFSVMWRDVVVAD